jgi:hypothetical protein
MKFRAVSLLSIASLVLLQALPASAQVQSTTGSIGRGPLNFQRPGSVQVGPTVGGGTYGSGGTYYGETATSRGDGKGTAMADFVARVPLVFNVNAVVGYDSNTLSASDNEDDSVFFNTSLNVSYTAQNPRANLLVYAEVGFSYYIDRPGREYDVNVALNGHFSYKINSRAEFAIDAINLYQPQPETAVVGGNARRTEDYFYISDRFALAYRWAPRFSTVTSYTPSATLYRQDPSATEQNRLEHLFTQEFRFLLRPTLTALGEYRFGYIDYFGINNDSYSNFVLGGVESQLSPRLSAGLRAGAEFREFIDDGGRVAPIVEARVSYNLTSLSSLSFNARYGIEQGETGTGSSTRDTFRMGLNYGQQIGRRLSATASVNYTHSDYNDDTNNNNNNFANFTEESVDLGVGAVFAVNRRVSLQAGYTYSVTTSEVDAREFDRHRVFAGVRLTF